MEKRVLVGILKVLILNFIVSGLLLVVVAFLSYKFEFDESKIQIGTYCIYGISNFLGGFFIGKVMEKRKFFWGIVEGGIYFLILLLLSLIVNGGGIGISVQVISALLITIISGMVGGIVS